MVFVERPQLMYNFTVSTAHTYFVGIGQWLVHNDNCTSVVKASDIYWSQNGVSWATRDGLPLDDLSQSIAEGWNGPPLRVVEVDGKLVSLDNRRLTAAKLAGGEVPITVLDLNDPEVQRIWQQRDGIRDTINIRGSGVSVNMEGGVN